MASKEELILWVQGYNEFKKGNWTQAVDHFKQVGGYCRILYNIGMIYTCNNDHESSIVMYTRSIEVDPYMAVSYFQKANAEWSIRATEEALADYATSLKLLLDNDMIDYKQLGLDFKLHRCEILFNMGMCYGDMGDDRRMEEFVKSALKCSVTSEQKRFIGSTRKDNIFTVPDDQIFNVKDSVRDNLSPKTFLKDGKVALDATPIEQSSNFNGFMGASILHPDLIHAENATLIRRKLEKAIARRNSYDEYTPPPAIENQKRNMSSPDIRIASTKLSNDGGADGKKKKYARKSSLPGQRIKVSQPPAESLSKITENTNSDRNNIKSTASKDHLSNGNKSDVLSYEYQSMIGDDNDFFDDISTSLNSLKMNDNQKPKSEPRQPTDDYRTSYPNDSVKSSVRDTSSIYTSVPAKSKSSIASDKIKIKVDATSIDCKSLVLMVASTISYNDLMNKIVFKLKLSDSISLNYHDEDQSVICITDDEDLNVFFDESSDSKVIYVLMD